MMPSRFKKSVLLVLASVAIATPAAAGDSLLKTLDREHETLVPQSGHAHAGGQVKAVDIEAGTVRIAALAIQSPDGSISRPPAEVLFHVTNRDVLRGLQPGDMVQFQVARIRGAVMITEIKKAS
jgi:Cu/Ag efflux protein CusF